MSRKNKLSLIKQVQNELDSKLKIGQSKYIDKKNGQFTQYIYSWSTYKSYLKHSCAFVKWAKSEFGCKTLIDARPYVDKWLESNSERSAYTLKLYAASLAKLYGCSSKDFIQVKSRSRSHITRSRLTRVRDKNFSETKNDSLVRLCRATGLRRHEVAQLRGSQLNGSSITVKGKGGLVRTVPIISDIDFVQNLMLQAGDNKVFDKIHSCCDIHSYRAEYATSLYQSLARPISEIPGNEKYYCRQDLKGVVYDKVAMLQVSRALGHNRINVIASHYLRCVN